MLKDTSPTQPFNEQILRWPEVQAITGIARNTAHTLARTNKFPKPIKLSVNGRASGWLLSEIQAWLQSRIEERNAGGTQNG